LDVCNVGTFGLNDEEQESKTDDVKIDESKESDSLLVSSVFDQHGEIRNDRLAVSPVVNISSNDELSPELIEGMFWAYTYYCIV